MPAQHIFTTKVKQVVIMMSQTLIKFLMLLNEKAYYKKSEWPKINSEQIKQQLG